jgi:ABC-type transporter Mla MlaB component
LLKITRQRGAAPHAVWLVLEGRLAGPWVEELKAYCHELSVNQCRCTKIDLGGVTFIDADGTVLLTRLWEEGAELRASGCLNLCVVEEITGVGRLDSPSRNCDEPA